MPIRITRQNISEHLLEYQLQIIGKTVQEAIADKEWIQKWSFSQEQADSFKNYAIPLIKKVMKCNKGNATSAFNFFNLQFGLKIR
jgi:hypothetical protein